MGTVHSKKPFTEWDLIQFSNITGIPQSVVADIYQDFCKATETITKWKKEEFRRLFRKMYNNSQSSSLPSALPTFFTKHDLNKISDEVFNTYDVEGTGKLTFEEFAEAYLALTDYAGTLKNGVSFRDRFNYILDQDNSGAGFVTREHGKRVFNRLNRYNNWKNSTNTTSTDTSNPVSDNWESHWGKLDDGSGRVPKEKFVDYVTAANDYKHHFDPAVV